MVIGFVPDNAASRSVAHDPPNNLTATLIPVSSTSFFVVVSPRDSTRDNAELDRN